jgi:thiol-disulfide isomerase/thioredoxin
LKKVIIFISVVVVLFAGIAIITTMQNNEKAEGNMFKKESLDPATVDLLDDPNYQNVILPEELDKKLEDGKDATIYFYSSTCPHCKETTPMLAPLAEEMDVNLEQYNVLEFTQGWDQFQIEGTPTVIHFENGKEVDRLTGSHSKETYTDFFNKYVKE